MYRQLQVAVVIPAYNEERAIVAAVANQILQPTSFSSVK